MRFAPVCLGAKLFYIIYKNNMVWGMLKKLICFSFLISAFIVFPVKANTLNNDTSDPLFMLHQEGVLSKTTLTYWDNILRAGQYVSYGLNNRLTIGANIHFQQDFDGPEDGFSAIDLGAVYRLAGAESNSARIIYDLLLGFKFGGTEKVRTPFFADSTYYAGLRFGRQWAGVTLAATIQSSWIFDETRGMSYIDFIPEAYFRVSQDWRLGGGLTLRKSTNPAFNQEWVNFKFLRQYGRTQYIGHVDYEFESDEFQLGMQVNILF